METEPKTYSKESKSPYEKLNLNFVILQFLIIFIPLVFGAFQLWSRSLVLFLISVMSFNLVYFQTKSIDLPPKQVLFPVLAFLAWGFFSCFYAPYPMESFRFFLEYLGGFFLVVVVLNGLKDRKKIFNLVFLFLAVCVFVSILAYLRQSQGFLVSERPGLLGTYMNHNHFAGLLELAIPFSLALSIVSFKKKRIHFSSFLLIASFLFLNSFVRS